MFTQRSSSKTRRSQSRSLDVRWIAAPFILLGIFVLGRWSVPDRYESVVTLPTEPTVEKVAAAPSVPVQTSPESEQRAEESVEVVSWGDPPPPLDWSKLREDLVLPGDRIHLNWGLPNEPTERRVVDWRGDLELRLAGRLVRLRAAGLRWEELRRRLQELAARRSAVSRGVVSVVLAEREVGFVMVLGEVKDPYTTVPIRPGTTLTVTAAIEHAGGVLETADLRRVRVNRKLADGSREMFMLDLEKGGSEAATFALQNGDVVYVGPRIL